MTRTSAALIAIAVTTCGASVYRVIAPWQTTKAVVASPPPVTLGAEADRRLVDSSAFQAWHRPLFSPPASKTDARSEATGSVSESKSPKLVGVAIDGKERIAVIAYDGTVLRVGETHRVGVWTVVSIEPHAALLQDAETSMRLDLDPIRTDN